MVRVSGLAQLLECVLVLPVMGRLVLSAHWEFRILYMSMTT